MNRINAYCYQFWMACWLINAYYWVYQIENCCPRCGNSTAIRLMLLNEHSIMQDILALAFEIFKCIPHLLPWRWGGSLIYPLDLSRMSNHREVLIIIMELVHQVWRIDQRTWFLACPDERIGGASRERQQCTGRGRLSPKDQTVL